MGWGEGGLGLRFGIWLVGGWAGGCDKGKEGGAYEIAEDGITLVDLDFAASIVDGLVFGGGARGPERAVETNPFHGVVEESVVGFGGVHFGVFVDGGEMLFAFVGEVVV